jgi:predicted phosphodiesterase
VDEASGVPSAKRSTWGQVRLRLARIGLVLLFCVLALGGSILSVCSLGRTLYEWRGFAVELRLMPSKQGQTRLELTPIGEVVAHTHLAPVTLVASLREIQVDRIRKLLASRPTREMLAQDFERTARADLRDFVLRQLAMAALGGMLAPLLFHSRRFRLYAGASLLGMFGVGMVLGNALTTFNSRAFASPTYTGALRQAPWAIQFGHDAFTKIEALSQKLRTVALNLNTLYGRIERLPGATLDASGADTFRVLHVSDIHNNRAALDFIREVADDFKVRLIVDTGDLTDFGSPPETVIVRGIEKLPYPYVFVAGNHDSRTVIEALSRARNVTLLNGKLVTVEGLTLLGLPNPASARAGVGSVDTTPQELAAGGAELLGLVNGLTVPPDIVAIHDPAETRPLWGHVPLILCGHLHRDYVDVQGAPEGSAPTGPAMQTVICNAGTTGAAGLRYFEREQGVPFSCAVLTFRRPAQPPAAPQPGTPAVQDLAGHPSTEATVAAPARPHLISIDLIALNGTFGEYSISHHNLESDANGGDAPAGTPPPPPAPIP